MRQNINDSKYKLVTKNNSNSFKLKYGLTTEIVLGDLDFDKIVFKSNEVEVKALYEDKAIQISNKKFYKNIFPVENEFESIHKENTKNCLILNIADDKIINKLNLFSEIKSNNSTNHIKIFIGKNSVVNIIDQVLCLDDLETGLSTNFVELFLEDNSQVNYFQIQNLNQHRFFYSKKISTVKANAKINFYSFDFGGKVTISDTISNLKARLSKSEIQNVFFTNNNQQFDISGQAIHKFSHTFSNVEARGAMKHKTKALYKGNIHIQQNAGESSGFQKAKLLILDKEAEADAIPQLLIDNDDVKCSHSVAIGRIDEEQLFYLKSRGLPDEDAQNLILKGFFEELVNKIPDEKIVENLKSMINKKVFS